MSVSLKIKDQNGAYAYTYAADAPAATTQKTLTDTPWMTVKFQGDPGNYTLRRDSDPIGTEAMFTLASPPLQDVLCEVTDNINNEDFARLVINSTTVYNAILDWSFRAQLDGVMLGMGYSPINVVTGGHLLLIQALPRT